MKSSTCVLITMGILVILVCITGRHGDDVITLASAFFICMAIEGKKS